MTRMPQRSNTKPRSKRNAAKGNAQAKTSAARTLTLPAQSESPQLATLHSDLKKLLALDGTATLDASAVTRVDTAMLQLLVAFVRERQANGRNIAWQSVPASFADTAQRLGLTAALGLSRA